jgi:hypothetical protein
MGNFSTNQVRHLYVAKALGTADATTKRMKETTVGAILPSADTKKQHLYFEYQGAGGRTRSDLIDINKVVCIKKTPAGKLATSLQRGTVTLNSEVNGGELIPGQDYILRIIIHQFAGMSDEDSYIKYGMVHAVSGMTASTFYKRLAISLAKNFSREPVALLRFKIGDTEVTPLTKESDLADEATGVIIEELEQDWTRGIKAQVPVYFDIVPTTVTYEGDEVIWGNINEATGKVDTEEYAVIGDGKKIADLEYFCMGERGDIYRNVGWPVVVPTTYLVDESKEYDSLDIHYYYEGAGENPQKSEKDLTIVAESAVMTSLVTKLESVSGLTVQEVK